MNRKNGKYGTLNLDAIRARLEKSQGKEYWRSLEELADSPEFQEFLDDEFPTRSPEWLQPLKRRDVLRLMGASFALAGLTACTRQPTEKIVPYVKQPDEVTPGNAMFYATAMPMSGGAMGLLVESHLGRPTKIEGNPQHPGSLGATDIFAQASVLDMYDPDRSRVIVRDGRISSWVRFLAEMSAVKDQQTQKKGAGLRILTQSISSPTLVAQIQDLQKAFPLMQWHQYEPVMPDAVKSGTATGQAANTIYQFDKAEVVLALDSDFLACGSTSTRHARDFINGRRVRAGSAKMNRLYVVEPTPTSTGGVADHRLPLRAGDVETFARLVAQQIGAQQAGTPAASSLPADVNAWATAAAHDLLTHKGAGIVIAGYAQPPAVHALALQMNQALGNIGTTVSFTDPVDANPVNQVDSLWSLTKAMFNNQVDLLIMLGGNPVYDAPADMNFRDALMQVPKSVHLSLYEDETSEYSHWHIPETHYLESWSDARAFDGTITILQPLIAPLYESCRSSHEILTSLTDRPDTSSHEIVRTYWTSQLAQSPGDLAWRTAVHDGVVPNTAYTARAAAPAVKAAPGTAVNAEGLEIVFRPDPAIWDGRYNNNGWLQEMPKPLTKLTWDNAAIISPQTADKLHLQNEDVVELKFQGRTVNAPVWTLPGQADDCVTVHLGYGRKRTGRVGKGTGFDAYSLRTSAAMWHGRGLEIRKTGEKYPLACTQNHHALDGRDIIHATTIAEFAKDPEALKRADPAAPKSLTLYPQYQYSGYSWGMSIDMTACVNCSACVVACQAENNVPVVGKDQVVRGREMHWLRIDRYYSGDPKNPKTFYQPMLCQHCENAPCELVCPVAATVHSAEGLNEMVYNRCVGTRYCSNNCPYKVRRFNFYLFQDWYTPSLYGMRNPEVTVRSRGVMEKCTYCVQRIQNAKINAEREDRLLRDGEIVTACQQVCPTQAIVFGNINDTNSRVAKLRQDPLSYGTLGDLNTRPRTLYMSRVRNPNPELEKG